MTNVVQFGLLGIGLGAIYALMGQGIVLIYRGSGVLNIAQAGLRCSVRICICSCTYRGIWAR